MGATHRRDQRRQRQDIFRQEEIEVPKNWTALATKIAVSKYFYGDIANGTDPHKGGRETSVRQLIHRVTRTITDWGVADGYFADSETAEIFYDELTWLCVNQHGAFNSPVWFNVGLYHQYGIGKDAGTGNYFYNREDWSGRARLDSVPIPTRQRLFHSIGRRHDGRHHAPSDERSHALQIRERYRHRFSSLRRREKN